MNGIVVSALVSAVISGALGVVAKYSWDNVSRALIKDRHLRQAWAFLRQPTHVFLGFGEARGVGTTIGYGDSLAMADVVRIANTYFPPGSQVKIHSDDRTFDSVRAQNLVIIGGPRVNRVYPGVIDKIGPPLHFFDTPPADIREIRNRERSVIYSVQHGKSGEVAYDVGMLIVADNPFSPGHKILVVAGVLTYGTAAAMQYFTEPGNIADIKKCLSYRNFMLVVGATVRNGTVEKIERISNVVTW